MFPQTHVREHRHEFGGTNPTMIKAMACGCAILALDTVFNKEMLNNDSYGIYFEKNQAAVRQQIDYADQNPKQIEKLSQNSRLGITDKYNWDCIADQYLEVFRELTEK